MSVPNGSWTTDTVDGRNLASLLKQIHAISLRLAPRPLLNIGAQFGQVGLGHARFRPLTTYERFARRNSMFSRGRGVANM